MEIRRVCVYCASSGRADAAYPGAARRLGGILGRASITVVYGGGSVGSMGALADGALEAAGRVIGVLPRFMDELEWGHRGLTELVVVETIHERKKLMIEGADAVVALPGGSGTLDELLEAITWKRLGLYVNPLVIVNLGGFFAPLMAQLDACIRQGFMDERHGEMWRVVDGPEEVLDAIRSAPPWSSGARGPV